MPISDPAAAPESAPSSDAARVGPIALVLLLVLVAAAGLGAFLLLGPHLEFTNTLAAPVRLVVGDDPPRTLQPGEVARVALRRGETMVAQWELVRPLSADGKPMGEEVRGSAVLRGPKGTLRVAAGSRTAGAAYFAPLITNASAQPLLVTANVGLQGARECGCAVRPGARRAFVGYYRLYENSTVGARASGVGSAVFRDLGAQVTARDGSVGLRFEDKDLRR
ncbi:MAG TPA: hypothetical protein VMY76_10145 [Gemmatimonadales bacterium]|nr:hypothetical protein [Gemmatimonadales bacterium]